MKDEVVKRRWRSNYEMTEEEVWAVEEERRDLQERTKSFALRVVKMYDGTSILPLDRKLKLLAVPISKLWEC